MEIVKNTYSDNPEIMQVFAEARRAIARFGIEQWQNGYPDESVVKEDISLGGSYSVRTGGVICGLYVAVSDSMRGLGLSKMIFVYVS